MIIGGQKFPKTAKGYWLAANHVETLGPAFRQDARELREVARQMEIRDRTELAVTIVLGLIAVAIMAKALF